MVTPPPQPGSWEVARADGEGRIVLETRAALRSRVRARAQEDRAHEGGKGSAVDALLAERRSDGA